MTIQFCDKRIEDLENDIENINLLINLLGAGMGYEETLLQKENELAVFTAISNIKGLKSLVQQLEYIFTSEYENGPANGPGVTALINIINVTPKKRSYRTAFSISKSIDHSVQKTKKRLLSEIKEQAKNLIQPVVDDDKENYE
jgi:hypothetical protein